MSKTIAIIGAFDTKGPEYAFLREQILARGHEVLTINTGTAGTTDLFPIAITADEVAKAGGQKIEDLRQQDRGKAMKNMSACTPAILKSLYEEGRFDGVIGMGGTGGSSVITAGMQALPIGVPKVCVSTAASGDTSVYVGTKDITMIPSIVDVAGINRISKIIFSRAAGAVCGMVEAEMPAATTEEKPIITASMFGNTTKSVDAARQALSEKGYEVLVFHATGAGGKTMESLVAEGLVDAVLDITTTEWADEVCDGVLSAGPERLSAPGQQGVPHLIVPGCVDMANFGGMETVPQKFKDGSRTFYEWNPSVTLMRTNAEENRKMGKIFAEKANAAKGPVAFLIPLKGVSILDGDGEMFCDREADQAMFDAIKANVKEGIPVVEVDYNINDPEFSAKAVEMMLELIAQKK